MLVLLPFCLLVASDARFEGPDRLPSPERLIPIKFARLKAASPLAGVWRLEGDEHRFGGVSALAVMRNGFRAVTDSGVVIDFPRPTADPAYARLHDLPDGPGRPTFKKNRDAESLVAVPNGWWVGFEHRHSAWLFDRSFRRAVRTVNLSRLGWSVNAGAEAMVADEDGLLILPEPGREAVLVHGGRITRKPLRGARGSPADATRLADGTVLVTIRSFGLAGISNRIARLERWRDGYRLQPVTRVPIGPLDNVEGLAAEPLQDGRTRLWMITDNDFSGLRSTLLIALDLPIQRSP